MVTSHSAGISGLAASTTYHYRVKSRDAAGNLTVSGDLTLHDRPAADTTAPTISGVGSSNVSGQRRDGRLGDERGVGHAGRIRDDDGVRQPRR